MANMAIIYWSQTGNTEAMAQAIAQGAGEQAKLFAVSDITPQEAAGYDKLALGCPAMGAEVLEEEEFEPFFAQLEGKIGGKPVALFGSYGWGDGQWMRDWEQRVRTDGGVLYQDAGLILNETPDDAGLEECRAFGRGFAAL